MIKKFLYLITALVKLSFKLHNPLVIINYLFKKIVKLRLKNGLILLTSQILDALVVKDTVIDDSYQLSSLKSPVRTVIDVGAGLGDLTVMVAKQFPKANIIAFEPNPDQFKLFKENIKINKVNNVKGYQVAVGIKKSYLLHIFSFNIHSSTIKTDKSKKTIKVKGIRLDSFIKNKIDLLKIDCEGAELEILESISNSKIGLINKIVVEYHNNIVQNEDKKILTVLSNWKYKTTVEKNELVSGTGYIFAKQIK